jgi:hypothetical protein
MISSAGITYGDDLVFTTGWDANHSHLPDELRKMGNTVRVRPRRTAITTAEESS